MSHTLVIASRELRERSRVFLMASAMAVLPFLAALVPAARHDRPLAIAGIAGFLSVALALGVAVAQGTSTIAGDLVERRMSFYFTKPVSPAAIWFGKTIAALVTSLICFAIVAAPAFLATGDQWRQTLGGPRMLAFLGIGVVLMFLFSHVLSTIVRSRSGLIGIDFVLAAATVAAVYFIVRPVLFGSQGMAAMLLVAIGIAFVVILAAAPVWQLARGRSDIRRSHAALSRALWTTVAAVLLVAGVYVAWLVRVSPSDLAEISDVEQAPAGSAVFISGVGSMRGDYQSSFLIDTASGRATRIQAPAWWGVRFSQDGKVAAWLQPVSLLRRVEFELYTKRLDQRDAPVVATGIRKGGFGTFALSPDGTRVAVLNDSNISVHELATHRLLAAASRGDRANAFAMFFPNRDVVRLYQSPRNSTRVEIYELVSATKSFTKTGSIESQSTYNGIRASQDGSRILLSQSGIVADAKTGAIVAKLPMATSNHFATAMLCDGTIAVAKRVAPKRTNLSVFAADGTLLREIALPAHFVWISGETESGKLIATGYDRISSGHDGRGRKMFVIDPARGTIDRTMKDLKGPTPNFTDPRANRFREGQPLVAANAEGKLVTWNASTGAVTPFPSPR